jgi:hypothetical protein
LSGLDPTEVRVAGSGSVSVAPEGTALPTDADTPLAAAYQHLGYISEDGVSFTLSRDQTDINAWQATEALRVLITAEPKTVAFELMQFEPLTVQLAFRGGTFTTTGTAPDQTTTFTPPGAGVNDIRAMVVEALDGSVTIRYSFSRVALQGDVTWQLQRADAVRLPLEFGVQAATPPMTIITNDPAWVGGVTTLDAINVDEALLEEQAA